MTLQFEIVTPEKIVFQDTVDEVIAMTTQGQVAILPHHVSFLTKLEPGELTVKKGGTEEHLAVNGGFLEVSKNKVTVLADYAIRSEDIELEKAQEAKRKAEKLMQEKVSEKDFAKTQYQLRKSLLELKIGEKRKRHRSNIPGQ